MIKFKEITATLTQLSVLALTWVKLANEAVALLSTLV
ncbi:hypothetical protein SAMN05421647_1148 [Marinobacterium stanieri]|uniref:Uncharacterized protein n=1 Tax=Marinobacterium stanieri TaxID=49186 RepID=A0A1N6XG09_9GAMM|nr:hypothetical protein SAMN05421647_1148 [Marinobacterium stanieri]